MNAMPIGRALIILALSAGFAGPVAAQPAANAATPAPAGMKPPMNDFNQAFYRCDNGGAFSISYDSDTPATAEITTNDDNKPHALKRTPSPSGAQFTGGAARFWTDGKTVVVEGPKAAFKNCKMKAG